MRWGFMWMPYHDTTRSHGSVSQRCGNLNVPSLVHRAQSGPETPFPCHPDFNSHVRFCNKRPFRWGQASSQNEEQGTRKRGWRSRRVQKKDWRTYASSTSRSPRQRSPSRRRSRIALCRACTGDVGTAGGGGARVGIGRDRRGLGRGKGMSTGRGIQLFPSHFHMCIPWGCRRWRETEGGSGGVDYIRVWKRKGRARLKVRPKRGPRVSSLWKCLRARRGLTSCYGPGGRLGRRSGSSAS